MERITHAAVRTVCGLIMFGKCHGDCFQRGAFTGLKMSNGAGSQGFFTSEGRYVNREIAAKIAFTAGQTREDKKVLISEDLWSRSDGGLYDYDPLKGYVERDVTPKEEVDPEARFVYRNKKTGGILVRGKSGVCSLTYELIGYFDERP